MLIVQNTIRLLPYMQCSNYKKTYSKLIFGSIWNILLVVVMVLISFIDPANVCSFFANSFPSLNQLHKESWITELMTACTLQRKKCVLTLQIVRRPWHACFLPFDVFVLSLVMLLALVIHSREKMISCSVGGQRHAK